MKNLKVFVNTPEIHEAFLVYLKDKIAGLQKSLEQATKIEEIYRLQGQIISFRRLLGIREEVNSENK